jgi:hypothetical protein
MNIWNKRLKKLKKNVNNRYNHKFYHYKNKNN